MQSTIEQDIQLKENIFHENRQLFNLVTGFWRSMAIQMAAKFDIARYLANGKQSSQWISHQVGLHDETLFRVMRALAVSGVFIDEGNGEFSNSSLSSLLLDTNTRNIVLLESNPLQFKVWLKSEDYLMKGYSTTSGQEYWNELVSNPDYETLFANAMHGLTRPSFVKRSDFSAFETVCDVGGSQGWFMEEILKNNSNIKVGINFDLPSVIELKQKQRPNNDARAKDVSGSFFESVPEADCYTMKRIMHDWNQNDASKILQTISKAIKPNGKVYIYDFIVDKSNKMYDVSVWYDLHMLNVGGGKERTEQEWKELASLSGFIIDEFKFGELIILSKK
ncbi:O-methyltransferase family 2 protein [Cavenderia fasciculata]|uniref:O-methyltransferase family 2 protein n=1 Tax=Cavenderia fasciculata TaxID=261658 RepID=F4Q749_CACFS|nr:O-methyltransferase family 2 protein [Cavenderia fasciculata]EGG16231.1 O-methyltransferase family 2 protein [Cavenderia fasciculata]|eukprot:XP_004354615.1 O-methyltransferase family 2 protein [Cavenderia fasciculata]